MRCGSNVDYCAVRPVAVLILLAALMLAGCSSTPTTAGSAPSAAEPTAVQQESAQAASDRSNRRGTRSRRSDPSDGNSRARRGSARVEDTEFGFTITENVRIAGDIRSDYQRALQFLEREQYEQGIELLVGVTERAPDVTAPHIDLGIAYGLTGDLESAEASLLTALELHPNHPVALNELGIVYRKTGRFHEARQSYEKALAVHEHFHFGRRNLGILCDLYLADYACALENYEAYQEAVNPDDEEVAIWIADIRNRIGQ